METTCSLSFRATNNGGTIASIGSGTITISRSTFAGNTPDATANIDAVLLRL